MDHEDHTGVETNTHVYSRYFPAKELSKDHSPRYNVCALLFGTLCNRNLDGLDYSNRKEKKVFIGLFKDLRVYGSVSWLLLVKNHSPHIASGIVQENSGGMENFCFTTAFQLLGGTRSPRGFANGAYERFWTRNEATRASEVKRQDGTWRFQELIIRTSGPNTMTQETGGIHIDTEL